MALNNDSLGDRMKRYEDITRILLPRRIPVIIRVDGRAFHTLTRKYFGKSWDMEFVKLMIGTASKLVTEIQGCDFAYCQSDEISLLLTDYRTINTEPWFGYDLRKIVSVSASIATDKFCYLLRTGTDRRANVNFDSRAFSVPQDDACNYFIWRQQDATRNAIEMAGREYFSHKELHEKTCDDIREMLFQRHGVNFNDYPTVRKRGFAIVDGKLELDIPIFTQDRNYVERHVYVRED